MCWFTSECRMSEYTYRKPARFHDQPGSTTNSISQLVTNEVPLASLNIAPIDIDEIAPLPPRQSVVVSSALDTSSIPAVTTPLSASRLRLLQDTTMIESALDLDSLEDASVGRGSQAGLIKMGVV
ncbi:hypothetical protein EAI_17150 [Harpegnathos saltator]|uniref:Uncharacterized protein n=1 Tax=Harpegnathos saltator TaxID=610380 RepID=E2BKR3_HARSA|nr:hypothetical protein EAI_17150 [Harpegnathos saltator]